MLYVDENNKKHCFMLFQSARVNQQFAKSQCSSLGAHLATFTSYDEVMAVESARKQLDTLFIGLEASGPLRHWSWVTGENQGYTRWNAGQPSDSGGNEDCAELTNGNWNDVPCSVSRGYVCEYEAPGFFPACTDGATHANTLWQDPTGNWHCYSYDSAKTASFESARTDCQSFGTHLVTFTHMDEYATVTRNLGLGGTYQWMDGTENNERIWGWHSLNGEGSSFDLWSPGEPNNSGEEDCMSAVHSLLWNDARCASIYNYVCEREVSVPLSPTTCTGGDSRVVWADPSTSEYHCYTLHTTALTKSAAQGVCASLGGYLVSIRSEEERNVVSYLSLRDADREVLIGFSDASSEGTFAWDSGEPVDATFWRSGEPNNSGGIEDCVQHGPDGQWNDISCSRSSQYICEYAL